MASNTVQIVISFDALVAAVTGMSLADKQRLLDVLEEQVGEAEEDAWERDPTVSAEMQRSRDEYAAGDYITFEEYVAEQADDTKPAS